MKHGEDKLGKHRRSQIENEKCWIKLSKERKKSSRPAKNKEYKTFGWREKKAIKGKTLAYNSPKGDAKAKLRIQPILQKFGPIRFLRTQTRLTLIRGHKFTGIRAAGSGVQCLEPKVAAAIVKAIEGLPR